MVLRLQNVTVDSIGPVNENGFGWVSVDIVFHDETTQAYPSIRMHLPLAYQQEWTIQEIQRAAADGVKQLIEDMYLEFDEIIDRVRQPRLSGPSHP